MDKLLEGRTAVIIAHRLATVRRADDILIWRRVGSSSMGLARVWRPIRNRDSRSFECRAWEVLA